ncbi:MAG: hypothetical protein RSH25_05485 [Bacteroides sp.]|uniref:hypothetical protein n=1 Tax=Bacteroides sp. TaxID=29523 RepID=UPI002FCBBB6F
MKVTKEGMTKSDIEKLSNILSRQDFKFGKCSNKTRIKIVRMQILLDPIAEAVKKARETADKQFMSSRLKELLEKVQQQKMMADDPDVYEFDKLFKAYNENVKEAMTPVLDATVDVKLEKLSLSEYDSVLDSNADWISGGTPKFLFLMIVDDKPEEKTEEVTK